MHTRYRALEEILASVHEPAVDWLVLERICDVQHDPEGWELAHKLIRLFLSTTPPRLSLLSEANEKKDFAQLLRLSHQLKSSGANLGAGRFRELCVRLEGLATDAADARSGDLRPRLEAELEATLIALKEELSRVQVALALELERKR